MLNLRDENSVIYKKGILINKCVFIVSFVFDSILSNNSIYKSIFFVTKSLSLMLWVVLYGTKEVVAKKIKKGYFYYLLVMVSI